MISAYLRDIVLFSLLVLSFIVIITYPLFHKRKVNKEFFSYVKKYIKEYSIDKSIPVLFFKHHSDVFSLYPYRHLFEKIHNGAPSCKWDNYRNITIDDLGRYGTELYINLDNKDYRLITDLFVAKFKFEHLFWKTIANTPESIEFIRSMPDLFCFSGVEEKPFWAIGKPHKLEMFGRVLYVYSNETDILMLSSVYVGLFITEKNRLPKSLRYYVDIVIKLQKRMSK